jgi:vancomycin resistance protein YoaR
LLITEQTAVTPSKKLRPWWIGGAALALLVLGYLAAYVVVGGGIARGTTVLGVPIGGRSAAEARAVLESELADEVSAALPVRAGDTRDSVSPDDSGLTVDMRATVEDAKARSWNPVRLVDALFGGTEVAPVVKVDETALRGAVEELAARVDEPPTNGTLAYAKDGSLVRGEPAPGHGIVQPEALAAIEAAYLSPRHLRAARGGDPRPLPLPMEPTEPAIGDAELDRVTREVAEPAVAEPVQVTAEGTTATIDPREVARALSFVAEGERLVPQLDGERLHAAIDEELAAVEQPGRDASFDVSSGEPRVVPGEKGRAVLPETLADAVLPVLTASGSARAVTVPLEISDPQVSTAEARDLGVRELVSEFTTYYPSDFAPRLQNIHRAADLLDETLVLPGETFSFNDTVGERTAANGFAPGFIISGGKIAVDYGGGVSQLVTTTFNAGFFAGLEIVEHHPHSFYISRYPEGREATVAWGAKDLRLKNAFDTAVFITTSYTNSSVTVRVWGTKVYRIEATKGPRYDFVPYRVFNDPRPAGTSQGSCVATDGISGFKVVVERLFYQRGELVRTEEFRTTYNPEHEVNCGYRPAPQDDPPAEPDDPDTPSDEPSAEG